MGSYRHLLLVAVALLSTGCATVFHGRYQDVPVSSDPPGASAKLECAGKVVESVTTPASVRVRRGSSDCRVVLDHPGFDERTIVLQRKVTPAFWGNLGIGGGVGLGAAVSVAPADLLCDNPDGCSGGADSAGSWAFFSTTGVSMLIDGLTGAMWGYEPRRVDVSLGRR